MNDLIAAAPPGDEDGGRTRKAARRPVNSNATLGTAPSELQTRTFLHPHQKRAVHATAHASTLPGGPQLVGVFGPPGVGKSKTCQLVENVLSHEFKALLEADDHVIPVVSVEAPPAINHEFPWREAAPPGPPITETARHAIVGLRQSQLRVEDTGSDAPPAAWAPQANP
jgi:hypothetical protein